MFRLHLLVEHVFLTQNTVRDSFLHLGRSVGVSLRYSKTIPVDCNDHQIHLCIGPNVSRRRVLSIAAAAPSPWLQVPSTTHKN
jgi:hypothetical protein